MNNRKNSTYLGVLFISILLLSGIVMAQTYRLPLKPTTENDLFEVTLKKPKDGVTLHKDHTWLKVKTNKPATCFYNFGSCTAYNQYTICGGYGPISMESSKGKHHYDFIDGLSEKIENKWYEVVIICTNDNNDRAVARAKFFVDLPSVHK